MKNRFSYTSVFNFGVRKLFNYHEQEGVLNRLTPCWEKVYFLSKTGPISEDSKVFLKIGVGPALMDYVARHTHYKKGEYFVDIQEKGPFKEYTHRHEFSSVKEGSILRDNISYKLPFSPFSDALGSYFTNKKLLKMFRYRHRVTENDINFLSKYTFTPMRIGVTGARGDIGRVLVPFLKTHGHTVVRFVRDKDLADENNYYWETDTGKFYGDNLDFDAIIHLGGAPIGKGRWGEDTKTEIIKSRVDSTRRLSEFILTLEKRPKIFLSASAIGYYGDRGNVTLTESDTRGDQFISYVCKEWETATDILRDKIRVVNMRIGIVISYCGGALCRVLPYFKFGLGMIFGTGDNYISFISMDDLLYGIAHCLYTEDLSGAVNMVSPNPVKQVEYADKLAKILGRRRFIRIPEMVVKVVFGQMGEEVLLTSTKVSPKKLLDRGFVFSFPDIDTTLRHTLGRYL